MCRMDSLVGCICTWTHADYNTSYCCWRVNWDSIDQMWPLNRSYTCFTGFKCRRYDMIYAKKEIWSLGPALCVGRTRQLGKVIIDLQGWIHTQLDWKCLPCFIYPPSQELCGFLYELYSATFKSNKWSQYHYLTVFIHGSKSIVLN